MMPQPRHRQAGAQQTGGSSGHGQRGVALITVLLIVAIATVISVQLMARQVYDIRRTENIIDRDQANFYALAAEAWSREVLIGTRRDSDDRVDHLNELWAQSITPPAFEGVQLTITMEDLQGRMNINDLVRAGGAANEAQLTRFQRLLQHREVDTSLLPALMDWIDADVEERLDGAEDDYYTRLDPAYRPANQPMMSVSELRLVREVDDDSYQALAPFLSALPETTPVNVNTASAEVLRTIAEELSEADAQALVDATPEDGYASVDDFMQAAALAGRNVDQQSLSVGSNWFLVRVEVRLGRTELRTESVIHRSDNGIASTVLRRQGFLESQAPRRMAAEIN